MAKRAEIDRLLPQRAKLRAAALLRNEFRSLARALRRDDGGLGLIAEVKRASPSAGVIAPSFAPVATATAYAAAGAHAVSVLTDGRFFGGSLRHLADIRAAVELPLLRKDFILDEVQIYEAVCAGADAILLIAAALSPERLAALHREAVDFQLDVLVEVHTLEELDRALAVDPALVGINNRDLNDFSVDLATTERLAEEVPDEVVLVSESGIKTAADSRRLLACGVDALLVGETLMRSGDIPAKIAELLLAAPA